MKKIIEWSLFFFLFGLFFLLEPYVNKNLGYLKFLIKQKDLCVVEAHIQQVNVEKYYRQGILTEEQNIALISYEIKNQNFSNQIEVDDEEIQRGIVQIGVNKHGEVFRAKVFNFGTEKYARWIVSLGFVLIGLILLSIDIIFYLKNRRSSKVQ